MKYTMKKTIAFLLTLVMLVNILPVSVLAEQPDEGRRGPLNAPATRASNGYTVEIKVEPGFSWEGHLYFVLKQEQAGTSQGNYDQYYVGEIATSGGTSQVSTFTTTNYQSNPYDGSRPVIAQAAINANGINQELSPRAPIEYAPGVRYISDINGKAITVSTDNSAQKTTITIGDVPEDTYTVVLRLYNYGSSSPVNGNSLDAETYTVEATDAQGYVYTASIIGSSNNVSFSDASGNPVSRLPEIVSWSFKKNDEETDSLGEYKILNTTPDIENGSDNFEKVYVFEARAPKHYTVVLDYLDAQGDTPDEVSLNDTYTLMVTTDEGESVSAQINTDGDLNSFWSDGKSYILKAQSFQIQDSQGNSVSGKLENYIITYPTNMDPDDGIYHISLHEPRPCTVSLVVLGTLSGDYDYYIVARKNGQAYAYAPFIATTTSPQFASITRANPTISEDSTFEVVRVAKGTSVADGSAFDNAAAGDKVTVSGNEMGENKITWNLEYPEDSDPNYAFTVEPKLQDGVFRRVHINLYDQDGETPSTTYASDLSGHKYFVRLYLYEKKADGSNGQLIGYQNQNGWIMPEGIQGADIDFSNTQFTGVGGSDGNYYDNGTVQYNPEQHNLQVRLMQADSNANESNGKSINNNSVTDVIEGYIFKAAPYGNITSGNTTVLNLKKAYPVSYHVAVQKGEGVDLNSLNEQGIKLYAEAAHQNNNKDYYVANINNVGGPGTEAGEYSVTVCDNGANVNWTNSPSDTFSGNEPTKARLVKNFSNPNSYTELTDGTFIKIEDDVFVVSYPEKTVVDDKETDPNNPKTVYTDYVKIEKIQVSNDYSYTSVLGSGVYYGITAQYFDQGGHIQSNFAANKYYPGNIVEPDLAGNGSMIVIADPQPASDGYYLEIGGSHVDGTDTVVYMGNNGTRDNVRNVSQRDWVHVVPSETDYLNESIVQPIINHGISISNELLQHGATFDPKTCNIDLIDLPEDATIYLDGDALKDWISKSKDDGLHITKHPNQTIVFNFDSTSDITLGQYHIRYDRNSNYRVTESPVGKNDATNTFMDNLAQHMVFNCSSAKNVTITNMVGMVLVPRSDSYTLINGTSAGWIISNGTVHNDGAEWHSVYSQLPSSTKTNLTVGKTVDGNTPAKNQKFEFLLEHLNTNHQWIQVPAPANAPEHFNPTQNVNGAVSFNNVALADEDAGWNVYKITETGIVQGTPGEYVTNNQTVYAFVRYIQVGTTKIATPPIYYITAEEDDEDVVLFKESSFNKEAESLNGALGTPSGDGVIRLKKMPKPSFENEQKKSGLYFKKKVIGVGNDNDTFTFRITLTLDENTSENKVIYKLKKTGNINAENITFKRIEGTNDFTAQVTLKRNQTANIDKIPEGVHYTIEEIKVNNKHITAGQTVDGYTIDSEHISQEGVVTEEDSDPREFINDRRVVTHFQIKKHVTGNTSDSTYADYKDEEFEFVLTPLNGVLADGTAIAAEDVPMPEDAGTTAEAKAENTAIFGTITYSDEGTFYYTITETAGSTPYMHYNTNPVYVKVVTTQVNNKIETTVSYSDELEGSYSTNVQNVTNTYTVTRDLTVDKAWLNAGGSDTWPTGVTVDIQLTADGTAVSGKTAQLSASKTSHKFTDLPKYQADGTTEIAYSVEEVEVPGYESEVGELTNGKITVTNTQKKTSLEVEKTWANADGSDTWPTGVEVTVQLTADGNDVSNKTLTLKADKTSGTFENLPKYKVVNGKETEIVYGVKELSVAGYTSSASALADGKITVTNTQKKTSLEVEKTWANADGSDTWPTGVEVTVQLTADGNDVSNKTLTLKADKTSGTFENLPKYKVVNGKETEIVYGVKELSVAGYTSSASALADGKITVTNTQKKTSLEVEKTWANADGSDTWPTGVEVTVQLTADGNDVSNKTLTLKADKTSGTFENLPKYKVVNGKETEIVYGVKELSVAGYTSSASALADGKITVTNTQKKTSLEVEKTWANADGSDTWPTGVEVTVQLTADGNDVSNKTLTLKADKTSGTFENLPKYKVVNGKETEIVYGVKELSVAGYTSSASALADGKITVTNTQKKTSLEVEKTWANADGSDTWPTGVEVTVQLTADGNDVSNKTLTLKADKTSGTFENLPKYKVVNGKETEIVYGVKELSVAGYTSSASALADGKITVTNTQKKTSLEVEKTWANADGSDTWPTGVEVTVQLTADGNDVSNKTLTLKADKTSGTFENLPKYKVVNGKETEIVYGVKELSVAGYTSSASALADGKITVTNTQKKTSLEVEKTWANADGSDTWPTGVEVTVQLTADGNDVSNKTLTLKADKTSGTFENLPKYKVVNGKETEIVYGVKELSVAGYTSSASALADGKITVTNTQKKTSLEVEKTWANADGSDTWPTGVEVTVQLTADGNDVSNKTLTLKADKTSGTFENLPKYKVVNGKETEIVYGVKELSVAGYTSSASALADGKITVTNTQKKTSLEVEKTWANADGSDTWPTGVEVTVQLTADGNDVSNKTLTLKADKTSGTFENLPKYKVVNGKETEIVYGVKELSVAGYTSSASALADGKITVTNTQQKTSVSVNKVWAFANASGVAANDILTLADGAKWPAGTTVSVQLQKSVKGGKATDVEGKTATLTKDHTSHTFEDLVQYEGEDHITYSVKEVAIEGTYADNFTLGKAVKQDDGSYLITNTEKTAGLTLTKTVQADNGELAEMDITFTVKNGEETIKTVSMKYPDDFTNGSKTITLTQADGILPGETYTVTESVTSVQQVGYTRTTTVTVDGEETEFTAEATDPSGDVEIDQETNAGEITFGNAYEQNTVDITVNKTWANADGSDTWPTGVEVTVQLTADGNDVSNKTLTLKADKTSGTFENLPKYKVVNGKETEIVYGVKELSVAGYTSSASALADGKITVTNTQKKTSLEVEKTWANADGSDTWPTGVEVTVQLTADGNDVSNKTLTLKADKTSGTFENLPKYKVVNGKETEIVYGVKELSVAGYTSSASALADGKITVTNTQKKTSLEVEKTWANADGSDTWPTGVEVTVQLTADGNDVSNKTLTLKADKTSGTFENLPKYKVVNGKETEIVYGVKELSVAGYTSSASALADGKITVTNTQKKTSLEVEKTWANADGSDTWPTGVEVTVQLTADGNDVSNKTLTLKADKTSGTFENLPKYKVVNGKETEIVYGVKELSVAGYTSSASALADGKITVTNTQQKTSVSVNKVWAFANASGVAANDILTLADGAKWPAGTTVSVQLQKSVKGGKATDVEGKTATLTKDHTSHTFEDLVQYEGEDHITYSVKEVAIEGTYADNFTLGKAVKQDDGSYLITNTEKTAGLTLTKTVQADNGELAEMDITFTVKNGEETIKTVSMKYPDDFTNGSKTITLTQADGILPGETYTVTESVTSVQQVGYTRTTTVTVDGEETEFTAEATDPSGDVEIDQETNAGEITFGNAYEQNTVDITVNKTWANADGSDTWPTGVEVTVQLTADGNDVSNKTLTLKADKTSGTFENLPKYKVVNGKETEIVYGVKELSVAGYTSSASALADGKITVTNTQKKTSLEVEKTWANADGSDTWPTGVEVTVQLTADGNDVSNKTLTLKADKTSGTFENLPKYKVVNGKETEIVYGVKELSVAGYTSSASALADGKITVTNTQKKTSLEVEKTWANADGSDTWPTGVEVTVQLTADGNDVSNKTLTLKADKTSGTFENLPKYKVVNGKETEIVYGVKELSVAGYTSSASALADGKITVTNTQKKTSLEVEKTWANADGSDTWPTGVEVTVQLTADGNDVSNKTLTLKADKTSGTFENLPKYKVVNGKETEIVYGVKELSVAGYTSSASALADGKITVTNTQKKTSVSVNKVWAFANASGVAANDILTLADGAKWPAGTTVSVQLQKSVKGGKATDVEGKTATLTKDHTSHTFEDLVQYEGEDHITYSVKEVAIEGTYADNFTLGKAVKQDDGSYLITNTEKTAGLTLTKTVQADNGELAEMDITFTVKNGEETIKTVSMKYPDDFTNGSKTITLTQADGILPGETYTVTESATSVQQVGYTRTTTVTVDGEETEFTAEATDPSGDVEIDQETNAGEITFGNAYEQNTVDITVNKTWANADGTTTWPEGIEVQIQLMEKVGTADATAVSGKTAKLTKTDPSFKFEKLPTHRNVNGTMTAITYSVDEVKIDGYECVADAIDAGVINIKNTQETMDVTVNKSWANAEGTTTWPEGIEVQVQLMEKVGTADATAVSGKTAKLTKTEPSFTFEKLPTHRNVNGTMTAITYSVDEVKIDGYECVADAIDAGVINIKNTQETMDVTVNKSWANAEGTTTWPEGIEVQVQLMEKVGTADATAVSGKTAKLTKTEPSYKFEKLPTHRNVNGTMTAITYSVNEVKIDGYECVADAIDAGVINIKNTQETTDVTVNKSWANADGTTTWPEKVEVEVQLTEQVGTADATAVSGKTAKLTKTEPSYKFEKLPTHKNVNGTMTEITYSVKEVKIAGYNCAADAIKDGVINITNTQETTELTVEKTWVNADGTTTWPDGVTVTVQLTDGGKAVQDKTATLDANHTSYKFENLPTHKNVDGTMTEITYSVDEVDVAGYKSVVGALEAGKITVTNTQDKTSVPVEKIWKNSDLDVLPWPEGAEVEVALVIDGTPSTEKTVKLDADQQEYVFENLPTTDVLTGKAYVYSVTETSVSGVPDGYTMVVSGDAENGFTITNTEDCTEVPVKKIWKNSDLEDLPWPEDAEVEVALVIDGTPSTEKTVKLDADQQEFLFEQLPITNADTGEAYVYSVTETSISGVPDGYTMVVSGDVENGFTITNTEDCTEVPVEKIWKSATGETLPWPGDDVKVTVTLVADGTATDKTVELSKDKMSDSFTDLPISKTDGSAIEYTVTESEVSGLPNGYTVAVTGSAEEGYTVTNTEIADVTAALKKVWKDEENRDGLRPTGLKVELLADGEGTGTFVMLNEENNWTAMLTGLLRFRNGKEIVYSWKEPTVVGYTLTGTVTNGSLTTLTNTHEADKTVVEVEKVWVDSGKHPDDVEVQLFADGKALGDAVKLNAGNGWKYSWTKLCRNVREAGVVREIKYTVAETKIPEGYVAKITGNASTGFVITNTKDTGKLIIEKEFDIQVPEEEPDEEEMLTEIEVVKIWDDNDNKDGNRPKSITVHLLAGGEEVKTAELTAANGWKRTFGDLPKFVNGHPIHYSVTEDPVPLYVSEIHGFTIRNKYQPELTSVSVRKVWNDENNKHHNRPVSVHMTLSNGMSVILSEENGWMATITGLPTIVNGQPAEYTWTEQEVVGYELESMETEGTVTVFTNKPWHRPDKPTQGKTPRLPGEEIYIEEYETPLGVEVIINHVGDCFD